MINLKKLLAIILLSGSTLAYAQITLPIATNLQRTYIKGTRTTGGAPGKNYWQNTAAYNIKVNFDPQNLNLTGTVAIDYVNNSPDTLTTIMFKLYPNFYKKGDRKSVV